MACSLSRIAGLCLMSFILVGNSLLSFQIEPCTCSRKAYLESI